MEFSPEGERQQFEWHRFVRQWSKWLSWPPAVMTRSSRTIVAAAEATNEMMEAAAGYRLPPFRQTRFFFQKHSL